MVNATPEMVNMVEALPTLMALKCDPSWHSSKSVRSDKSPELSRKSESEAGMGGGRRLFKSGSNDSLSSLDSEKIRGMMSKIPLRVSAPEAFLVPICACSQDCCSLRGGDSGVSSDTRSR